MFPQTYRVSGSERIYEIPSDTFLSSGLNFHVGKNAKEMFSQRRAVFWFGPNPGEANTALE